jgi:hypothetical protein
VRARRIKRLKAAAAAAVLALVWLGYSAARALSHERAHGSVEGAPHPVGLVASSATGGVQSGAARDLDVQAPASSSRATPIAVAEVPPLGVIDRVEPQTGEVAREEARELAPAANASAHEPFVPAKLQGLHAGAATAPLGPHHEGLRAPLWSASGGSGGVSGGARAAATTTDGATASPGNGRPGLLGHSLSRESADGAGDVRSNASNRSNGSNGSNGSSGAGGQGSNAADSNGDRSNGGNGSSTPNPGNLSNDPSGGDAAKNSDTGHQSNIPDGSGAPGGNGSSAGEPGSRGDDSGARHVASLVDDGSTAVRAIPEPGSILIGVGAAATLLRRRMR